MISIEVAVSYVSASGRQRPCTRNAQAIALPDVAERPRRPDWTTIA